MWSVSRSEKFSPQLWLFRSNRMWSAPPSWPTCASGFPSRQSWGEFLRFHPFSHPCRWICIASEQISPLVWRLRGSFLVSSALFTHSVTGVVCVFLLYCGVLGCYRKKMTGLKILANAKECFRLKLLGYVLLLCNKNGSVIQDYLQMPGCVRLCVYTYIESKCWKGNHIDSHSNVLCDLSIKAGQSELCNLFLC